jgi:asparagine synthetase B (glutamine-hydrolysing)
MPGITGAAGAPASIPGSLEELSAALFHSPTQSHHRWQAEGFSCQVSSASPMSGVIARDGVVLAFEGFLFDDARSGQELLGALVDRFVERGDGFVAGMNGMFQMAVHAGGRTRLYVDHLAMRRLFYRQGPGWLAFSPEVAPLADLAPARLNGAALVNFLANGRFFAGDTLLEPVRQLLPGEYLLWDGHTLERHRWHRYRLAPVEPWDAPQAMARLQEAVRAAILRHWERANRPVFQLTGGYDSRYIFLTVAEHLGDTRELHTATWGSQLALPDADAHLAEVLARRFGTRHHVFERRAERVRPHFDAMFDAISGMTEHAFLHSEELLFCRQLAQEHGLRSLFRGDESFGATGQGPSTVQEALAQLALKRAAELPGAYQWVEGGGASWLEAQADHVSGLVASCPAAPVDLRDTLYGEERLASGLHPLSYFKSHSLDVFNPLLDPEVLRIAATFPAEWRIDKKLFKACYHQRFGSRIDVPFAQKDNAVDWAAVVRSSSEVAEFLRGGLERLPAPLHRAFFLEKLAEARRPAAATPGPRNLRVAPEQLAIRAFVLGRWLERWPPVG